MPTRSIALIAGMIAMIGAMPANAQGAPVCPQPVALTEQPVAPPGATASAGRAERPFMRAEFYDGPIADRATLAPDSDRNVRGAVVQTYSFGAQRPRPIMVVCHYFETNAMLTLELPAGVTSCELRFWYDRRAGRIDARRRPLPSLACR